MSGLDSKKETFITKQNVKVESTKPVDVQKIYISTHVLDTSRGLPVADLPVKLYRHVNGEWLFLNESFTTTNGRCLDLVNTAKINFIAGRYKIHFEVEHYFTSNNTQTMYPFIEIVFDVKNPMEHYHIPILLSPFGFTTYRGS